MEERAVVFIAVGRRGIELMTIEQAENWYTRTNHVLFLSSYEAVIYLLFSIQIFSLLLYQPRTSKLAFLLHPLDIDFGIRVSEQPK